VGHPVYIYIYTHTHTHTHTRKNTHAYFRITRVNIILKISTNIYITETYHKAFSDGKINFGKSRVKIMRINSSIGRKLLCISCKITKGVISEHQSLQTDTMAMANSSLPLHVISNSRQTDNSHHIQHPLAENLRTQISLPLLHQSTDFHPKMLATVQRLDQVQSL